MLVLVSERADADLRAIYRYTHVEWGAAQAEAYVGSFDEAFALLAAFPQLARPRKNVPHPYTAYLHKKHLLLCQMYAAQLEVLAVLHQSMDIPTRIADMLKAKP